MLIWHPILNHSYRNQKINFSMKNIIEQSKIYLDECFWSPWPKLGTVNVKERKHIRCQLLRVTEGGWNCATIWEELYRYSGSYNFSVITIAPGLPMEGWGSRGGGTQRSSIDTINFTTPLWLVPLTTIKNLLPYPNTSVALMLLYQHRIEDRCGSVLQQ